MVMRWKTKSLCANLSIIFSAGAGVPVLGVIQKQAINRVKYSDLPAGSLHGIIYHPEDVGSGHVASLHT